MYMAGTWYVVERLGWRLPVGNDGVKHTNHCASSTANVYMYIYWRSPWLEVELDHLCGVENLNSVTGGIVVPRTRQRVYGEAPTRQFHGV